jgi:hypothetical protein
MIRRIILVLSAIILLTPSVYAVVSYQVGTPNSMEYPGRVEIDNSLSYLFTIANGTYLFDFGIPDETNGTMGYSKELRVGMVGQLLYILLRTGQTLVEYIL